MFCYQDLQSRNGIGEFFDTLLLHENSFYASFHFIPQQDFYIWQAFKRLELANNWFKLKARVLANSDLENLMR